MLLDGLNEMQREATINVDGPMLVIAGAGSGKTRVLTHRIAYLVNEKNVKPWNILAITFTNKAANEMKERMVPLVGEDNAKSVWISTFHSMCVRMLRRDIEKLGYTKSFTIYDDTDKKRAVRECMKKLSMDEKDTKPRSIMSYISDNKNRFITSSEAMSEAEGNFFEERKAKVYRDYEEILKANNALDFDDLLIKTLELLKSSEDVLSYYQDKFKYILVDEYQDTNKVQYNLVKLLGMQSKNVFVVGDDDQSIYGWRGADISNILNFEKDYDNANVIKLEQNYRSTQNILNLANAIIKNNISRKEKNLWSDKGEGEKVKLCKTINDKEEAKYVVNEIKNLVSEGKNTYSDFAIMYRTNAQSRSFEEVITKYNIPYKIFGSVRFYDRKEIKDIIAYLNVIVNEKDSMSIRRIINVPKRKIGDTSVENITNVAEANGMSFYDTLVNINEYPELSRISTKISDFVALIEGLKKKNAEGKISELVEELINKIDFRTMLKEEAETEEEGLDRIANVEELISKIVYYEESTEEPSLEEFLAEVMLMTDSDNLNVSDDHIKLMTIHVAKGLEFNTVFLVGFEDGLFPSIMDNESEEAELEEERRLLYVAITRARVNLYVTYAMKRMRYGNINDSVPSRFLREFDMNLCEEIINETNMQEEKKMDNIQIEKHLSAYEGYDRKPTFAGISSLKKQAEVTASSLESFAVDDKVEHVKFGIGTVVKSAPLDSSTSALVVKFESGEEKKFMYNSKMANNIKKIK